MWVLAASHACQVERDGLRRYSVRSPIARLWTDAEALATRSGVECFINFRAGIFGAIRSRISFSSAWGTLQVPDSTAYVCFCLIAVPTGGNYRV